MKRFMSILLSLVMVLSLAGVMNVAALAEEEAPQSVTVLVTGGVGANINGEGLSYASAAALKGTYEEDEVLLVDAGGFVPAAAPVMAAAGYDLVVPEAVIDGWEITSISMAVEELSAGAMFPVGELKIAFIGVAPMGEQEAEEYYASIRRSVELADENGADYILALGATEDAAALAENVTGFDAVLTFGGEASAPETSEESGEETEATPVISVGEGFEAIGVVTLGEDGLAAQLMDAEAYAERELEENEAILALQKSAALEAAADPGDGANDDNSENTGDGANDDNSENTGDGANDDNGEDTGDGANDETGENTGDGANDENGENAGDGVNDENKENADDGDKDGDSGVNTGDTGAADGEKTDDQKEESGTAASGTNAEAEQKDEPEQQQEEQKDEKDPASSTDAAADESKTDSETSTTTIEWKKGSADLELKFEHPVDSITIKGETTTVLGKEYYKLSDGDKTVSILANVLNGWGTDGQNNYYRFEFAFSDGAASIERTINITGTRPATTTPEPTATPDTKPSVKNSDSDVTAAWEAKGLTAATVKDVIGRAVTAEAGYSASNVKYYDVSVADGVDVSGGVEVTLPYPSGTKADGYDFIVVHYLASGTTELFKGNAVTEAADGVKVKATSLSPFAVAWKTTAAATKDGSPATGDNTPIGLYIAIFAVLLAAIVVVLVLVIRKGKKPAQDEYAEAREPAQDAPEADVDLGDDDFKDLDQ